MAGERREGSAMETKLTPTPVPHVEPRRIPVQPRAARTVERILAAAERLLLVDGYARTSTNRIAAEAGVSIGSLYQYFPNRETIMAALVSRVLDRRVEALREALLANAVDTPAALAAGLVASWLQVAATADPLAAVLLRHAPDFGERSTTASWLSRATELVSPLVAGVVPPERGVAAPVLASAIVRALYGMLELPAAEGSPVVESEVARQLVEEWLRGGATGAVAANAGGGARDEARAQKRKVAAPQMSLF